MKLRERIEFYLAKIAGRDVDMDKITPNKASSTVEELLDEIAERIDDIEEGGGGSSLPEVTEEDNGKVLGVVDGVWNKMVGGGDEKDVVEILLTMGEGEPTFITTVDGVEVHYEEVKDLYLGGNCRFVVFIEDSGLQLDAFQPVLNASAENISVFGMMPDSDGNAIAIISIVITENSENDQVLMYNIATTD